MDRDNEEDAAQAYQQELWEQQMQLDLPEHQRSGYAERVREAADDIRKQLREAA
jgi:hypothetical protein